MGVTNPCKLHGCVSAPGKKVTLTSTGMDKELANTDLAAYFQVPLSRCFDNLNYSAFLENGSSPLTARIFIPIRTRLPQHTFTCSDF